MHAPDPVLAMVRSALEQLYGARLSKIILFGSRARGDAQRDSDYDIAVILCDLRDRSREMDRLADISCTIQADTDAVVNFVPIDADALDHEDLFMHNIRSEGVPV
jgi:predicted nucleotidyltransferase